MREGVTRQDSHSTKTDDATKGRAAMTLSSTDAAQIVEARRKLEAWRLEPTTAVETCRRIADALQQLERNELMIRLHAAVRAKE
jgi:hypothetical protein